MEDFVLIGFAIKLARLVIVLAVVTLLLRWYDRVNGYTFGDHMRKLHEDPRALGNYLAGRIFAVFLAAALVVG